MSPSMAQVVQSGEDELIRARTMTVTQGPGFQVRQAAEVVIEETTARALIQLLSPSSEEPAGIRTDLHIMAAEFENSTRSDRWGQ